MTSAHVTYAPRTGATSQMEVSALVAAYAFVLQKHREKQKGGPATAPDDAKEIKNVRARTTIP
jgi:hypothetical protein